MGSFVFCVMIEEFDVNGCGIVDVFLVMVRNFMGLSLLNLGENGFMGLILIWLGWLYVLEFLYLGGNWFSGDVLILFLNCILL